MSSVVTVVTADNPLSIVLLVIRPVGERGPTTPTAAGVPILESVILHYLR